MNLQTYINSDRGNATRLCEALEIPLSYLSQMASGYRSVTPRRAILIEKHTDGVVSRKDFFPNDWQDIWPELEKQKPKRKPSQQPAQQVA